MPVVDRARFRDVVRADLPERRADLVHEKREGVARAVLAEGRVVDLGTPREVIRADTLKRLYNVDVDVDEFGVRARIPKRVRRIHPWKPETYK